MADRRHIGDGVLRLVKAILEDFKASSSGASNGHCQRLAERDQLLGRTAQVKRVSDSDQHGEAWKEGKRRTKSGAGGEEKSILSRNGQAK